jgi:hypothetical protein
MGRPYAHGGGRGGRRERQRRARCALPRCTHRTERDGKVLEIDAHAGRLHQRGRAWRRRRGAAGEVHAKQARVAWHCSISFSGGGCGGVLVAHGLVLVGGGGQGGLARILRGG